MEKIFTSDQDNLKEEANHTISVCAYHSSPGTLIGKLSIIWEEAAVMICKSESQHKKLISPIWQGNIPSNLSLHEKSKKIHKLPHPPEDILALNYYNLLHKAKSISNHMENSATLINLSGISKNIDISDKSYQTELIKIKDNSLNHFLNNITTEFFALQLYLYNLKINLQKKLQEPVDSKIRKQIAAKGGNANSIGEDILRKKYLDFLLSKKEKENTTIKEFIYKNNDDLISIFEKYKNQYLNKKHPETQKTIKFGERIKVENIDRQLKKWAKNDAIFKKAWESIFPPKKNQ